MSTQQEMHGVPEHSSAPRCYNHKKIPLRGREEAA